MKKVILVLLLVAMLSVTAFGFAPKPPWCWGHADHCKPGPHGTAGAPWNQWPGCPGNADHCRPGPGYGWSMAGWGGWNGCPGNSENCRGPHA